MKSILSRSEEVRLLDGAKSYVAYVNMSTSSDYVMPVVDSSLVGVVYIEHMLNEDVTDELLPASGNLESKYISKVVQFAEDNAAEDLMVILQEYRPAGTDVKVWARIKNASDIDDISNKHWFELSSSKSAVSSDINKENYIDTTYRIPAAMLSGGDIDAIQYTSSGNVAVFSCTEMVANTDYIIVEAGSTDFTDFGSANNDVGTSFTATAPGTGDGRISFADDIVYTRFSEFQIKIGMASSNRAIYPKASKLRAIALQR